MYMSLTTHTETTIAEERKELKIFESCLNVGVIYFTILRFLCGSYKKNYTDRNINHMLPRSCENYQRSIHISMHLMISRTKA